MSMISKQVEDLRKLGNQWKHNDMAGCNLIFDACDTIEELSAKVRANNLHDGWIPVSERLPKERDGRVLVSREDGQVTTGLHSEFSNVWHIGDMCGVGGCKVIAWMPLPEPYREDE